ncbi:MAG: tetratricopeptide repeat protein [Albidovulum sp.]
MSDIHRLTTTAALVMAAFFAAPAAIAAGSDTGSSSADSQPGYGEAKAAVDAEQYPAALKILAKIVKAEPRNADALNLMGYSNRKMNRLSEAARYYEAALKVNPGHLGALEYQGEMFVETGDFASAKANLSKLRNSCGTCEEMQDLEAALAAAGQS